MLSGHRMLVLGAFLSKGNTEKQIINLYSGTDYMISIKTYISYRSQTITTPVIRVRTRCGVGLYGTSCEYRCADRHCQTTSASCSDNNGSCRGQCQNGWMGVDCTDCHGTYGTDCRFSCSDRHCKEDNAPYDHVTGFCGGPCSAGWQGDVCMDKCNNNSYGENCAMLCADRHCINNDNCHHEFGICHGGCTPGWQGMSCMEAVSSIQDYKDSMIGVSVVAGILLILLVTCAMLFFWYVRRHRMKSVSTDSEMTKINRQTNQEDGLYEVMDGQSRSQNDQYDATNRGNISEDSGYVNSPRSREQSNSQERHFEGFQEGGYINSGQDIQMNEYEKLNIATTPQNAYEKLTGI